MPSFEVTFNDPAAAQQQFNNVEIFFNQFGWLTFTNQRREIVACCNPNNVKSVSQLSADSIEVGEGDIIEVETDDVVDVAGLRIVN